MASIRKWRGKYVIDYVDLSGQRRIETVGTKKKEAEERLAQKIVDIQKGIFNPNKSKIKFLDYVDRWQKTYAEIRLKNSTKIGYKRVLKLYICDFFKEAKLNTITRDMIREFIAYLSEKGHAPNYIRISLSVLRVILSTAVEDGYILINPATRMGRNIPKKNIQEKEINPFNREELSVFLESIRRNFPEYYPFFLTLARTGMRLGEAIGLQWGDIDFLNGFIEIQRGVVNGEEVTPKSGKSRRVDMSNQLAHVLSDHSLNMKKMTLEKGWPSVPDWVFCNRDGSPLNSQNVRVRIFFKALEKAGLRRVRIHDLRHTFASQLIQNGESLAYIRDQLGHHSIQITVDTYGHLVPGGNRQAVNNLDDDFWKQNGNIFETSGDLAPLKGLPRDRKSLRISKSYREKMVGAAGFEPATS